ncbi:MAG: hypothetical protein ACJAW8_000874 [Oleispira sp.]|jgi:hypothetical protein
MIDYPRREATAEAKQAFSYNMTNIIGEQESPVAHQN